MRSEWKQVRLGDLISVKHGYAFKGDDFSEANPEGPIVVTIGNFDYTGGFRFESTRVKRCVSEYPGEYEMQPGEVLLAMTCQTSGGEILGIPGIIPDDGETYLHNQRLGKVVLGSDSVDLKYLYWLFLSHAFNHHLFTTATGTKILHTAPKRIESYEFQLPPLPEQKAIAHILGTLDDKIELNRRMNATLEGMAQALFKSWFVDFDPVIDNALAAGNPIPDELAARAEVRRQALANGTTQQGSVDDSTLSDRKSIFPAAFQLSEELGWIPEGWESKTNGELFDVRDGTHDSPKKSESGKFLITSRHITGSTIDYSNAYRISEADFEEVNKRSKVDSYDILLTMIGTVGVPFLVLEEEINFAIKNVGLFKTGSDRTLALYFFTYLKTDYMKNYMESRLAGTTQKYLTLKILRTLPVVVPSPSVLQHFGSEVKPLFERMHRNNEKNQTLRILRDTLLPKLISGELRIPEAEQLTGKALA